MASTTSAASPVASPDGFANATASCPLGLEWVEKKKGYKNEFVRFALFGAETEAIMHHVDAEKQKDYYFHVEASAIRRAGERGFGKLCGARKDKQEVKAVARAMSKQLQHQTAENVGNWDAIIEMGKKGKAKAMQLDEDAAELNGELGGDGMQERVPSVDEMSLSAAKPVDCPICPKRVTPGSKDSITSPCGHTFHASCYTNWIVRKPTCPVCRKTLAPAPVESDGASDDDAASDDIVCNVCGDGTDGDNNPILMCSGPHPTQTGQCAVAMHMKCLDRPPASCIGVNCWCSQHWKLASRGDIKLAATAGTSLACTTAIDRAARGPPLRAGASASTLAPAAAKGKKPGSSIAKKKQMRRAVPKKGLPTSEQLVSKPIAKKRNGGIRITARVASCAKSLREQNNKENIIGLAQDLGIATVRCFHAPGGKRMMYDAPLQWIAVRLAEKLTGE